MTPTPTDAALRMEGVRKTYGLDTAVPTEVLPPSA